MIARWPGRQGAAQLRPALISEPKRPARGEIIGLSRPVTRVRGDFLRPYASSSRVRDADTGYHALATRSQAVESPRAAVETIGLSRPSGPGLSRPQPSGDHAPESAKNLIYSEVYSLCNILNPTT